MGENSCLVSSHKTEFKQISKLGHFLLNFNDRVVGERWEDRPSRGTAVSLRQRASSDGQRDGELKEYSLERRRRRSGRRSY